MIMGYKKLKVFYGFSKINKVMKKPELAIIFENANNNSERNMRSINKWMTVIYTRFQTEDEMIDAPYSNRMFTKYGYFIDDKPFFGDIEKVLNRNFEADKNHVSDKERKKIMDALRPAFYSFYKRKPLKKQQLEIEF